MKLPSNGAVFLASVALGAVLVAGAFGYSTWMRDRALPLHPLARDISITEQLRPEAMRQLTADGFATVIDMRPDGEAADEPRSSVMASAAQANHLHFAYVPVPHGDIPDSVVASLKTALVANPGPVLLYCRSGRRAARSWSLVEASKAGGMSTDEILAAVKSTGQTADDLHDAIARRVQARPGSTEAAR